MANINASELNTLQTRINSERSRRGLSPVTFTDGTLSSGDIIKATHFNELRNYTEGLNTLGSQTFNWSGTISVGGSISNVLTQIDNFVSTLEVEALASWKTISYNHTINDGGSSMSRYPIPQAAWGSSGTVRWKSSQTLTALQGGNIAFARVLRFGNYTPVSPFYNGGYHSFMQNVHHAPAPSVSMTFGGLGEMSSSIVQPIIGSWGDATQPADQTPYTVNNGKGSQSTDNAAYNAGLGTIAHSDTLQSRYYQSVANHWYYNAEAFSSSHPNLLLWGEVTSGSLLPTFVEIQAYY